MPIKSLEEIKNLFQRLSVRRSSSPSLASGKEPSPGVPNAFVSRLSLFSRMKLTSPVEEEASPGRERPQGSGDSPCPPDTEKQNSDPGLPEGETAPSPWTALHLHPVLWGGEPGWGGLGVCGQGLPVHFTLPDPRAGRGGLRCSGAINISTPTHPALRLCKKKNVCGRSAPPFQPSRGVYKGCWLGHHGVALRGFPGWVPTAQSVEGYMRHSEIERPISMVL